MSQPLASIVDFGNAPINDPDFCLQCKQTLDQNGALELPQFLCPEAVLAIQAEGEKHQHLAYFTVNQHNIFLTAPDPAYGADHPRNRLVSSSKGCITDDQIPANSVLRTLYGAPQLRQFLCRVLGETELHAYADALSSINLHYASEGQELGWHFDNSSFAITLLIQRPASGGVFEYVKDIRETHAGENNFPAIGRVLEGKTPPEKLEMHAGTLVLFRGRNAMHRVTPTKGDRTRMLVVLAYNTEPGISLSASAQMTFYGRVAHPSY
jgi:hypothetical protein